MPSSISAHLISSFQTLPIGSPLEIKRYQGRSITHGAADIFYWQRARADGFWILEGEAAVVASFREDVKRFTLIRPIGKTVAIHKLLRNITESLRGIAAENIVIRYCSPPLTAYLRSLGWRTPTRPWSGSAFQDDETFPEVIWRICKADSFQGTAYRYLRQAETWHRSRYEVRMGSLPLTDQDVDFILRTAPKAHMNVAELDAFNAFIYATASATRRLDCSSLRAIRLFSRESEDLSGVSIVGYHESIADGYLLSHKEEPRLASFFLAGIIRQIRQDGIHLFNLGGSEDSHLYDFKHWAFGLCSMRSTQMTELPNV